MTWGQEVRFLHQRFDEEPLVGPLYGWRLFLNSDVLQALVSLFRTHLWAPNKTFEAGCSQSLPQPVPHVGHNCGFHVFYHKDPTIAYAMEYRARENGDPDRWVISVVKASGNIVLHDQGFRSSRLRIVAVSTLIRNKQLADRLAQAGYQVAKNLDELATFAKYTADYYDIEEGKMS